MLPPYRPDVRLRKRRDRSGERKPVRGAVQPAYCTSTHRHPLLAFGRRARRI
eukprot:SAG11_NODE_20990_length_434_cov_1.014925_1_plen_51_part_10